MAFRPQIYRLKRIVELIRTGTADGRAPNCRDFCRELGLSRPTVMRYIAWLRDDEGAPIEFVQEKNGYRLTDRTWSLKAPDMTREELASLLMARKLAGLLNPSASRVLRRFRMRVRCQDVTESPSTRDRTGRRPRRPSECRETAFARFRVVDMSARE